MDLNRERWRTEWNKTFTELKHSAVPQTEVVVFDPSRWSVVNQRQPASYAQAEELEEIVVRAKTTDVHGAVLALAWMPYSADSKGRLRPAWS